MIKNYQVIVGNIGRVYDGENERDARKAYDEYVFISKQATGRAAGEDVTLFMNDDILCEHDGYNSDRNIDPEEQ